MGLLRKLQGQPLTPAQVADAAARKRIELLAMNAVIASERILGRVPRDISAQTGHGFDIESLDPVTGNLYFIEVKGRVAIADSVTLTKNEILCALNKRDQFRLAIVIVDGTSTEPSVRAPVYVSDLNLGNPGFAQTTATYQLEALLAEGRAPH